MDTKEKSQQHLFPSNEKTSKTRSNSFLENILGAPYTSKKSTFLGDLLNVDETAQARQRSHSIAEESPSRRPKQENEREKTRDTHLIMKSRNVSLTEALLGRRHSTNAVSMVNLNMDCDSSFESNSGNSGQSLDYLDTFDDPHFTVSKPDPVLDLKDFKPDSESEASGIRFIIEEAPTNTAPSHKKPMIDAFLDRVNNLSWVHGMIPKKKFAPGCQDSTQGRKDSGASFCDDLLVDRIYKHLNDK
eukprot:gene6366-11802_t